MTEVGATATGGGATADISAPADAVGRLAAPVLAAGVSASERVAEEPIASRPASAAGEPAAFPAATGAAGEPAAFPAATGATSWDAFFLGAIAAAKMRELTPSLEPKHLRKHTQN